MKEKIFNLKGEIWRPVVGYEGLYEVSNFGRVASLNYKRSGKRKLLKPGKNHKGYLIVQLHKNAKERNKTVHKLVAMAFQDVCGTYFEGAEIDHINGIRDDNRAENLRWCTHKENSNNPITKRRYSKWIRSEDTKRKISKANINHQSYSTPVIQYTKDGQFVAEYPSIREAERQTGIANQNISACCLGKQKTASGFTWRYAS